MKRTLSELVSEDELSLLGRQKKKVEDKEGISEGGSSGCFTLARSLLGTWGTGQNCTVSEWSKKVEAALRKSPRDSDAVLKHLNYTYRCCDPVKGLKLRGITTLCFKRWSVLTHSMG